MKKLLTFSNSGAAPIGADPDDIRTGSILLDIPLDRINPDTLTKMIEEFVTREWSELADSEYTLDEKVCQVMQQLKQNKAKIVYDSMSETCNIICSVVE
jgi:uncharacterized protein YheU (UPF0270 family)